MTTRLMTTGIVVAPGDGSSLTHELGLGVAITGLRVPEGVRITGVEIGDDPIVRADDESWEDALAKLGVVGGRNRYLFVRVQNTGAVATVLEGELDLAASAEDTTSAPSSTAGAGVRRVAAEGGEREAPAARPSVRREGADGSSSTFDPGVYVAEIAGRMGATTQRVSATVHSRTRTARQVASRSHEIPVVLPHGIAVMLHSALAVDSGRRMAAGLRYFVAGKIGEHAEPGTTVEIGDGDVVVHLDTRLDLEPLKVSLSTGYLTTLDPELRSRVAAAVQKGIALLARESDGVVIDVAVSTTSTAPTEAPLALSSPPPSSQEAPAAP